MVGVLSASLVRTAGELRERVGIPRRSQHSLCEEGWGLLVKQFGRPAKHRILTGQSSFGDVRVIRVRELGGGAIYRIDMRRGDLADGGEAVVYEVARRPRRYWQLPPFNHFRFTLSRWDVGCGACAEDEGTSASRFLYVVKELCRTFEEESSRAPESEVEMAAPSFTAAYEHGFTFSPPQAPKSLRWAYRLIGYRGRTG